MSIYELAFRIFAIAVLYYSMENNDSNQDKSEPNPPRD